jgi:hypothetical protein
MSWLPIDGHAHQELQTKAVFFTSFGLRPHQGTYFEVQDLHEGERAAYHDLASPRLQDVFNTMKNHCISPLVSKIRSAPSVSRTED